MSFLQRLKDSMSDPRFRAGRDRVAVNERDLDELIRHFESLDSMNRMSSDERVEDARRTLTNAVETVFKNNGQEGNDILLLVTSRLETLMGQESQSRRNRS